MDSWILIQDKRKEWDENSDWEKIDQVKDRCIVTLGSKGSRLNGDLVDINKPVEVLDLSSRYLYGSVAYVVLRERNTT